MEKRSAAVAAILFVLVAGCAEPEVRSQANASVTIDGKDQGRGLPIRCNQLEETWFLDIGEANTSATAIVTIEGDNAAAETVQIRGFGGFNGGYWQGGDNSADATLINQIFTITGTASGVKSGDPKTGTAEFKITARC